MPRKLRIEFPGACFHVTNRGNFRRDLFDLPGSAAAFERTLLEACEAYAWRLHAFVIMRNHFHLALELQAPTLSVGMKWLQGTWSMRFNRFHNQVGRPFQGRFKAKIAQPGPHFARVVDYIHLNPVRARLVPPEEVDTFPHSSFRHFLHDDRPACLISFTALSGAGGLADNSAGWAQYRQHLVAVAKSAGKELEEFHKQMRRGWCIGTEEFKRQFCGDEVGGEGGDCNPQKPNGVTALDWNVDAEETWEKLLRAAAGSAGINLDALLEKMSAPEKIQLAARMRASSSASIVWLSSRLQMGSPSSLSKMLHRFRQVSTKTPRH